MSKQIAALLLVITVILLSIFLPAELARVYDHSILDTVQKENGDNSPESFRYSLTSPQRLYVLSMALNNHNILQSDYAASLREKAIRTNRNDTVASFAYVENGYGLLKNELDAEKAMEICTSELSFILKDGLGMDDFEMDRFEIKNPCRQTLYSAVDMLEPQKSVSVWQIEYDSVLPPDASPFSLIEAHVDAETGKLYSFSFRTDTLIKTLTDFDADKLAKAWLSRLNITAFSDITENSPLAETAKQYKKFATEGMNTEKTVFTVGFYEGINEVFVRITN